jgi:hypothetical protein
MTNRHATIIWRIEQDLVIAWVFHIKMWIFAEFWVSWRPQIVETDPTSYPNHGHGPTSGANMYELPTIFLYASLFRREQCICLGIARPLLLYDDGDTF